MFHQRLVSNPRIRHYSCVLFPGQGAQYVGMTSKIKAHPAVQSLFKQANDILGYDLQSLCLKGPEDKLKKTEYCQPAVVVSSLAAATVAANNYEGYQAAAGFSIGEMTALIFTNAISFEDGLQLVAARAKAMQSASEMTPSSLVRILGMNYGQVEKLCGELMTEGWGDASVAIKLYSKANVIACSERATGVVSDRTRAAGGSVEVLNLSGAFHSSYMSPAVKKFTSAVNSTPLIMPTIPVYSSITAKPFTNIADMKELMIKQLSHCVLWNELVVNMRNDYPATSFVECGPGKQLHFLLKKMDKKIKCISYNT